MLRSGKSAQTLISAS